MVDVARKVLFAPRGVKVKAIRAKLYPDDGVLEKGQGEVFTSWAKESFTAVTNVNCLGFEFKFKSWVVHRGLL